MKKRAFVRYTKEGKIVPGSLIMTKGSHPKGPALWVEVPVNICCEDFEFIPISDAALKQNLKPTGNKIGAFTEYTWEWNNTAKRLKLDHYPTKGVIAQEVIKTLPTAVIFDKSIGYYRVDYSMIKG